VSTSEYIGEYIDAILTFGENTGEYIDAILTFGENTLLNFSACTGVH
jgi:hypothetical protein